MFVYKPIVEPFRLRKEKPHKVIFLKFIKVTVLLKALDFSGLRMTERDLNLKLIGIALYLQF